MTFAAGETSTGSVVDFDEAMLDACAPAILASLMTEARLLAQAFAPEGRSPELRAMAQALSSGAREADMDRRHARQLAAALRRLARESGDEKETK